MSHIVASNDYFDTSNMSFFPTCILPPSSDVRNTDRILIKYQPTKLRIKFSHLFLPSRWLKICLLLSKYPIPADCCHHLRIHYICHFFSTWHIFGYNFSPHKKRVNRDKTDFTVKQRKPLIN